MSCKKDSQVRAAKIIFGSDWYTPTAKRYSNFRCLSLFVKWNFTPFSIQCELLALRSRGNSIIGMDFVFFRLNASGVYLKFGSFVPVFFRVRRLIGVRCLLMKCDFQPFFQVDLLLPILENLVAVCQCWTIFSLCSNYPSYVTPVFFL